jgi:hypothetical protein
MNRQVFVGVSILLAAAVVAGFVVLSSTGTTNTPTPAERAVAAGGEPAPGTAAMRAYLNPETGRIETGPVPLSDAALDPETENALRRDSEGLVEVRHADGSVSIDLQGRFQNVSILRIDENGKTVVCTEHAECAGHVLQGGATGAPEVK